LDMFITCIGKSNISPSISPSSGKQNIFTWHTTHLQMCSYRLYRRTFNITFLFHSAKSSGWSPSKIYWLFLSKLNKIELWIMKRPCIAKSCQKTNYKAEIIF
jgi:hypothetical protein